MELHHGLKEPRGIDAVPHSPFYHGRFGRLFRRLPAAEHTAEALEALAGTMIDRAEETPPGGWGGQATERDNPAIPAGYTYLGQFIDHDITFDPVSSLQRANDPDALINFRTPRFDLDSVYGEGPDDEPFLYDQESGGSRLLVGANPAGDPDLPRNSQQVALIGDPRNDENVIVSQLQSVFLRLHNRLQAAMGAEGPDAFERVRQMVRWHYQRMVVDDFLPRVVGQEVVADILRPEGKSYVVATGGGTENRPLPDVQLRLFNWSEQPFMPVEFSVAAYRFGHTLIRPRYDLNGKIRDKPIFDPNGTKGGGEDLRGFQELIGGWAADWTLFFELDAQVAPQPSRRMDHLLAEGLSTLPFAQTDRSLAARNLKRGLRLGLPSGEDVARAMCLDPLTADQIALPAGELGEHAAQFSSKTPLWFYILREADTLGQGQRLGPVGGRIVAEVLLGLLWGDPFSYLRVFPCWDPPGLVPQQNAERLTMPDLVRFALEL